MDIRWDIRWKRIWHQCWLTVWIASGIGNANAGRDQGPIMMGVMGDSISAATLADYPLSLPESEDPGQAQSEISEIQKRSLFENKATLSWASGKSISSHFLRLRDYLRRNGEKRTLQVDNVSERKRTSAEIEAQVQELVDNFIDGKYSELKYVTLLIGANDACSSSTPWGIPAQQIHDNILKALGLFKAIHQSEPIRMLVVGLPRIPDLGEKWLRSTKTILGLSCEYVRNQVLKECNPLLLWNTEEEYLQKAQIIEQDNQALMSLVEHINAKYPNIQAVYTDSLYQSRFSAEDLAADCFHPNALGQSKVADLTWAAQPWFR